MLDVPSSPSWMSTQLDIHEYIKQYEDVNPPRKEGNVPTDPSKKWWFMKSSDKIDECIQRCRFKLYQTALTESGIDSGAGTELTHEQRVIHLRYASMQNSCNDLCKSSP